MNAYSIVIYYLIFSFFYIGFLFHNSTNPVVYTYSLSYSVFLIILALGFFLPLIVRLLIKRIGAKNLIFSLIPLFILLVIVYFVSSLNYYYSQTHFFDPYLQVSPPEPIITEKQKDTYRILTLGGSTTYSSRLPGNDRYPTVLQNLIQSDHPKLNIEVFNAGMDWYTTKHSLINYVTNLREWQPDLVIVMHAINDLYRSCPDPDFAVKPYNKLWSHYYGPSIKGAKPPTFEKHIFGPYFRLWFSRIRYKEQDIPLDRYKSINDFERYLRHLVHYLKSDNVHIILMTQPYLYKGKMSAEDMSVLWFGKGFCKEHRNIFQYNYPSAISLRTAMDAFNNKTKKVALDKNVLLVDLELEIKKDLEHFIDDVHYTAKGAHQVAEIVSEKINEVGLIKEVISATDQQLTNK